MKKINLRITYETTHLLIALTSITLAYTLSFSFRTNDLNWFFEPWILKMRELGLAALDTRSYTNYTPFLLNLLYAVDKLFFKIMGTYAQPIYVQKTVCVLGSLTLAFSTFTLAKALGFHRVKQNLLVMSALITPSIFLNSVFWGQYDTWYTAFVLLSIAYAPKSKTIPLAAGFFVFATCCKLQSVFVLPALSALFFKHWKNENFDLKLLTKTIFAMCVSYFLSIGVSMTQGMPWTGIAQIYSTQSNTFSSLSMNAPNVWSLFPNLNYQTWVKPGLAIGFFIAVLLFVFSLKKIKLNDPIEQLQLCLLSSILMPLLLPKMHERYFIVAEVISLVLAFTGRPLFFISYAFLQFSTVRTYSSYLFNWSRPPFIFLFLGLFFICIALIFNLKNKEPLKV